MNQQEKYEVDETTSDTINSNRVQMAWQLFVSLEYQVQVADRKVQAVFGMNAFLVAAISFQNQQPLQKLLENGVTLSVIVDLFLKLCFLACVCIATWSAIRALTPRFKIKSVATASGKSSLFYFGDIQTKSFKDFSSEFITTSKYLESRNS